MKSKSRHFHVKIDPVVVEFLERLTKPPCSRQAPSELLCGFYDRWGDFGAPLARAAAVDPRSSIRQNAFAMLYATAKDPDVPFEVRRALLRSAGPELLRAFRDPAVDDDRRHDLGALLSLCGVKIGDKEYRKAFADFEGTVQRRVLEGFAQLPFTVESLQMQLETTGLIPEDGRTKLNRDDLADALSLGAKGAPANPHVAAALLCITAAIGWENGLPEDSLGQGLATAAATGCGPAAWFLQELGRLPAMGRLGERAARLATELGARGVAPEPIVSGPFLRGAVSPVDGSGSRTLVLLMGGKRRRDALSLLLNDGVGLKDTLYTAGGGGQIAKALQTRKRGVIFAPCDLEFARKLVGDTLAVHQETGRPVPGRFLIYRHFLGIEPIQIRRHEPDLSAYGLEDLAPNFDLVAGSDRLAELPIYETLYCASDAAYRFVEHRLARKGRGQRVRRMPEGEFQKFLDEIAVFDRDRIARRLAVNLEVEALAGQAGRPVNQRLARLYLGITRDVVPFGSIPFVRALHAEGVNRITENLLDGYRNQEEVNQAGLALDEEWLEP